MATAASGGRLTGVILTKPHIRLFSTSSGVAMVFAALAALAILELGVRSIASGYPTRPLPLSSFAPDPVPGGEMSEYREYREGLSVVHFWRDGSRVTGNAWAAPGLTGVILGDSFAEAYQVGDSEIAASVLERRARQEGRALNVRQYGWSGTSVPVYAAIAPKVLSRLNPAWTAVLLIGPNLGMRGLTDTGYWQAGLRADGTLDLKEISETERIASHSRTWRATRAVMERSVLSYLVIRKLQEAFEPKQAEEASSGRPPADRLATLAEIRALRNAYGSRLLIVYIPAISLSGEPDNVSGEQGLLEACKSEGVRCVSMRQTLIRTRDTRGVMCAGFSNSLPGEGHFNAHGHRALADLIWDNVRDFTGKQ